MSTKDLFTTDSVAMARSLEALAKEIAAAAKLYQRLPAHRSDLAAGLKSLMDNFVEVAGIFELKHAQEAAHAPQE